MRHGTIFSKNNQLQISVQLYQIKHKYSRVTDNPRNYLWHNSQNPVRAIPFKCVQGGAAEKYFDTPHPPLFRFFRTPHPLF